MKHQLEFEKPIFELQRKLDELRKHPEKIPTAGIGPGTPTVTVPNMLIGYGYPLRSVLGYNSSARVLLALEQALNGLQFGLMLFLLAAGLTLVFGIMDMINLAHGSLYMLGAFVASTLVSVTGSFTLGVLLAVHLTLLFVRPSVVRPTESTQTRRSSLPRECDRVH